MLRIRHWLRTTFVGLALAGCGPVEAGSPCAGGGEGATNCGAAVLHRYQDGVLSGTALWPWPNEERIKKEMCTDAGVTRGFCGKASITEYVWTYLGNSVPATF
jgi:hypothetical protein